MSRPSKNVDKLLLKAGLELLPKTGFSGLTVRRVTKQACVNLGMFHYHFKTKRHFTQRILQDFYEDFFKFFLSEASIKGKPKVRLIKALSALGRFTRDNRRLVLTLLQDVLMGHRETIGFVGRNFPRHLSVIVDLITQCQKSGEIRKMAVPKIIPFLIGSVAIPNIVVGLMERTSAEKPLGMPLETLKSVLLPDSAIEERVEMALKGLSGR